MSDTYDQKPAKSSDNFKPVTVTREEFTEIIKTKAPFWEYLRSKGIIHKKGIHVESWTPEDDRAGAICYRNYRQKTDSQIAGE